MRSLGIKTEEVAVGQVMGDGDEIALQSASIGEFEALAAGQPRHALRHIALEAVGGQNRRDLGRTQRRGKQAEAVEGLLEAALAGRRIRVLAHAAVRRPRSAGSKDLRRFVLGGGLGGRKHQAVDGGIGAAEVMKRLLQLRLAAMVHGLADEQNGAAVLGRLPAQQIDGKPQAVEDGCAAISGFEIVQGVCHSVHVGGKRLGQAGRAVEVHDRDLMGDGADDCFDGWAEVAVFVELASACAAGFNGDDQRQRLAARVLIDRDLHFDAVVGENEILCGKREDRLSGFGPDQGWDKNQRGARREHGSLRWGRSGGLSQRRRQADGCEQEYELHGQSSST